MAQPQPGTAKRRVMGRMEIASGQESPSLTPTARPRIIRAHHGASSPGFGTPPAQSSRPATSSGRAKVDMSAFTGSSSAVSSPKMSPPLHRNGSFVSSNGFAGLGSRPMVQSPSTRLSNGSNTPSRPLSTIGLPGNAVTSPDARGDNLGDTSFVSLRAHKARGKNVSVDLSGGASLPGSPAPTWSHDGSTSQVTTPMRAPLPRSQTSSTVRLASPASSNGQPHGIRSVLAHARIPGIPAHASPRASRSRTPSPSRSEAQRATDRAWASLAPAYESPRGADAAASGVSPRLLEAPLPDASAPPLRRRSSLASTSSSQTQTIPPSGTSVTLGRAHTRSNSAFQRPSVPQPIATHNLATSPAPLTPGAMSPTSQAPPFLSRGSFSSSNVGLRSPTSEVSTSEQAEADEARRNRKLLDLEITNRSLLAINAALEVTKLKQAREIRDLKRRLREGRGMSLAPGELGMIGSPSEDEDADYFEDADEGTEDDAELEAAHVRCKTLIDHMLNRARSSILSKYEASESVGSKVLHPVELEQMRREQEDQEANLSISREDDESFMSREREDTADISSDQGDVSREAPEIEVDSSFASDIAGPDQATPTTASRPFDADVSID